MDELNIGKIRIEQYLPDAFKDEELRTRAQSSLDVFQRTHGDLPLKFRIEQFCFNRSEQICTVDSARKYIAWAGGDRHIAKEIFGALRPKDLPLVLRSHPFIFGGQSPVFQMTVPSELEDLQRRIESDEHASVVWEQFFEAIPLPDTVIQLFKNPYAQKGLFLCRPTFVYDRTLRKELRSYRDPSPQYVRGRALPFDGPDELVALRIIPLVDFAREKKRRTGGVFVYNPSTKTLDARGGFPHAAKDFIEGEFSGRGARTPAGRTIDYEGKGESTLHFDQGPAKINPHDAQFLTEADIVFAGKVLSWQLPRINSFEDEIRGQAWIPQGLSNTHQFVIFPPEQLDVQKIDTQYYDFRPHAFLDELIELARAQGRDFRGMSIEDKIVTFF